MSSRLQRVVVALALLALSVPAIAQPLPSTERDWSATLGIDFGALTTPRSLWILGSAATVTAWSVDELDEQHQATTTWLDRSFLDPVMDVGNVYGGGWVVGGGSLSVLAAGELTGRAAISDLGVDLTRSYLYSGLMTGVLKFGVGRRRPSGGPLSFPSGHTTSAFSTIPVVWHHLGWQAGLVASALAGATGLGRMEENRHYFSDVVAGAAIGFVVGKAIVSQRGHAHELDHLTVSTRHVGLQWEF